MNKKQKSVLSVLLTLLLLALPLCSIGAFAAYGGEVTVIAEGNCGVKDSNKNPSDNATFTITSDGVMTVRGTGATANYFSEPNSQPWQPYRDMITTLIVEPGITVISDRCFWLCRKITSVSLPDTLVELGQGAFYDCRAIESISLPESLRIIGISAFRECGGLTSVVIPDGVVSIGEGSFRDCHGLRSAVLPEGPTMIPEELFFGCDSLNTVTVPGSVTKIDKRAFYNCDYLTDVYYLAPLAKWSTIEISDSPYPQSLSTQSGNKALERASIHSHVAGGGTSGISSENVIARPTCADPAGYDRVERCSLCGLELARIPVVTAPATGLHTPGEPVRENKTDPTCATPGGYDEVVFCTVCAGEISRVHIEIAPLAHRSAAAVPETAATDTAHGFTAGVYCPDCGTWLSGHEVIHNTAGERTYLNEYTEDGEQMVIIKCTVCGEEGLYAMEPVSAPEPPLSGIRKAISSIINFILRLLKWLSRT